jgi:hypothetical protein
MREKGVCNARTSVLETPGRARDQEQDMTERKQELARRRHAWRSRRLSGRISTTWRHMGKPAQGREGGGTAEG